jgi:hypothetical protein
MPYDNPKNGTATVPNLPVAPVEYNKPFMDQLLKILQLYFTTVDNIGPLRGSVLNLSTIDQVTGLQAIVLPTQASLSSLRTGDIYYDTSAGNVLKIKT